MSLRLTVLGSGDAFGSGGRLQTAFHLQRAGGDVLIDCGTSVLVGMARAGLDTAAVRTIVISHLHGDHFGGLVFWLMQAHYVRRRTAPLTIAGPPGLKARLDAAMAALFPGSEAIAYRFPLDFVALEAELRVDLGSLAVTPYEVSHPSGAPSYALRLEVDGRALAYSGDTAWVEALHDCARDADLFITECYAHERDVPHHVSWRRLHQALPRLTARRILVTHMSTDMLAAAPTLTADRVAFAHDGLVIDL